MTLEQELQETKERIAILKSDVAFLSIMRDNVDMLLNPTEKTKKVLDEIFNRTFNKEPKC